MSTLALRITGMTCQHCVRHTREALEKVAGVDKVDVSLEAGEATVEGQAAPDNLLAAIKEAGYEGQVKQ